MKKSKILDIIAVMNARSDLDETRELSLKMLRQILWFDMGIFWTYDPLTALPKGMPVALEIPKENLEYYVKFVYPHDETIKAYRKSDLNIIRASDFFNYREWTGQTYFNENCRPFNMYYHLNVFIKDGLKTLGSLCLSRNKMSGDFSRADMDILNIMNPHLVNMLSWHYTVNELLNSTQSNLEVMHLNEFFEPLTARELDIVQMVLKGYTNNDIGVYLGISLNTVKMHLKNIYSKLNIGSRSQLFSLYLSFKH